VAPRGLESFLALEIPKAGRAPKIDRGLRDLIQADEQGKPAVGRVPDHGELLMVGFEVAQSTSQIHGAGGAPPSQSWKTFLRNHRRRSPPIDLCVVPTLTFERLFAFWCWATAGGKLLWFEVTRHPTAEWLARQITEAFRGHRHTAYPGARQ